MHNRLSIYKMCRSKVTKNKVLNLMMKQVESNLLKLWKCEPSPKAKQKHTETVSKPSKNRHLENFQKDKKE